MLQRPVLFFVFFCFSILSFAQEAEWKELLERFNQPFGEGKYSEASARAAALVAFAEKNYAKDDLKLGIAYEAMGNVYYYLHQPGKALEFYDKSLEKFTHNYQSESYNTAVVRHLTGIAYLAIPDYEEAKRFLQQSLTLYEQLGKTNGYVVENYKNLSELYFDYELYEQSERYIGKGIVFCRKHLPEEKGILAGLYNMKGEVQLRLMQPDSAMVSILSALELAVKAGTGKEVAHSYNLLGISYTKRQEYARAKEYYQRAYGVLREDERTATSSLSFYVPLNLSSLYGYLHQMDSSVYYYQMARRMTADPSRGVMAYEAFLADERMGTAYEENQRYRNAISMYRSAYNTFKTKRLVQKEHFRDMIIKLARCYEQLGRGDSSVYFYKEGGVLVHEGEYRALLEAGEEVKRADGHFAAGRYGKALEGYLLLKERLRSMGSAPTKLLQGEVSLRTGRTYHAMGKLKQGIDYLREAEKHFEVVAGHSSQYRETLKLLSDYYRESGDVMHGEAYREKYEWVSGP